MKYILIACLISAIIACDGKVSEQVNRQFTELVSRNLRSFHNEEAQIMSSENRVNLYRKAYHLTNCEEQKFSNEETLNLLMSISTGKYLDPVHKALALCSVIPDQYRCY